MEKCDVAIVGGGIAGLSVAKFLAEKGISFILFEEHNEFFKKPCGEGVIQKTMGYDFYELYGSKKGVEKEIWETIIHTHYGKISLEMPVIMTDKRAVEAELARQAKKGGEIRMGERVGEIKDGVLLPQQVKPKIIIGADGVFSIVRKYAGIKKPKCGMAVEAYSNEVNLDNEKCHVIMRKDVVKYGYAWYFPKKDKWNIGVGSSKKKYFKESFEKFKKKNPGKRWKGAFVPLDKPLKSYGKNAILIGDAAAHVLATLGAGIMTSMIVANIAANHIEKWAKKDYRNIELSLFEKEWRNVLGKYLKYSYYVKVFFFDVVKSEYLRHKLLAKMCRDTTNYYRKIMKK